MTKSSEQKQRQRHWIYTLEGVLNFNKVIIKGNGRIKLSHGEAVNDTLIGRFELSSVVHGDVFLCNLVDKFLMSTKKLPMFYINIMYEKPLMKATLFTVFLFFTIEDEIKSESELINSELNGHFSVELIVENKNIVLDSEFSNTGFLGNEPTLDIIKKMISSEEIKPIIQSLIKSKDEERRKKVLEMYPGDVCFTPPIISYKFDDLL